jgi:hypothetical protein
LYLDLAINAVNRGSRVGEEEAENLVCEGGVGDNSSEGEAHGKYAISKGIEKEKKRENTALEPLEVQDPSMLKSKPSVLGGFQAAIFV